VHILVKVERLTSNQDQNNQRLILQSTEYFLICVDSTQIRKYISLVETSYFCGICLFVCHTSNTSFVQTELKHGRKFIFYLEVTRMLKKADHSLTHKHSCVGFSCMFFPSFPKNRY